MNINAPTARQIPGLKALWQQAFGDTMAFIDGFFATGFSPDRCRCICIGDTVAAALYWFDATGTGGKFAYIYAVATETSHRGKGLCRLLMENTHRHLAENGYAGAVLLPAEPGLWDYYGKLGYRPFGSIRSFSATAGSTPLPLQEMDADQYLALRSTYLPENPLTETGAIRFYGTWGKFFRGDNCLFAAAKDNDRLYVQEFLGDPAAAPEILAALGCRRGNFRSVNGHDPCGMCLLFASAAPPGYLGFPLD